MGLNFIKFSSIADNVFFVNYKIFFVSLQVYMPQILSSFADNKSNSHILYENTNFKLRSFSFDRIGWFFYYIINDGKIPNNTFRTIATIPTIKYSKGTVTVLPTVLSFLNKRLIIRT